MVAVTVTDLGSASEPRLAVRSAGIDPWVGLAGERAAGASPEPAGSGLATDPVEAPGAAPSGRQG